MLLTGKVQTTCSPQRVTLLKLTPDFVVRGQIILTGYTIQMKLVVPGIVQILKNLNTVLHQTALHQRWYVYIMFMLLKIIL